jgi:hypothetical protein
MINSRRQSWCLLILLGYLSLGGIVGCGSRTKYPPLGVVTGVVTYEGKPLPGVAVFFQPVAGNRCSTGATGADGRFELTYARTIRGAEVGEHEVAFEPVLSDDGTFARVPAAITKKKLRVEVKKGANDLSLELAGK